MTITEELDERSERLNKRLQAILKLFLLGELSSQLAKALGRQLIIDEYTDFMVWYRTTYKTQPFDTQSDRIRRVVEAKTADFYRLIDAEGEKTTEPQLKHRAYLIALSFVYALHRATMITYAIEIKAPYLRWNTQNDSLVCSVCEGLAGIYRPEEYPETPHLECRCYPTIAF